MRFALWRSMSARTATSASRFACTSLMIAHMRDPGWGGTGEPPVLRSGALHRLVHRRQWDPLLARHTRAILVLRRQHLRPAVAPAALGPHRPPRRLDRDGL